MTNSFDNKGYQLIDNFLDKDKCTELTNHIKSLVNSNKTFTDTQCPLSQATYSTAVTDRILEEVLPKVEQVTGKTLYPTYAFARLYNPNDELKVHRDRPSCEYSVTLTLEYEGNQWPIYMGPTEDKQNASKIEMNTGDAVVYKGCDVWHWREKYTEGKWQAQIFLHYVDANGPYAEYKYDKRPHLLHHLNGNTDSVNNNFALLPNYIEPELCDYLVKNSKNFNTIEAEVSDNIIKKEIRDTKRIPQPPNLGIAGILTSIGFNINDEYFKFNVNRSEQAEILIYEKGGKYEGHLDLILSKTYQRKLTVLTLLNDEFEGGGFWIQAGYGKEYPKLTKGSVIVFPSYLLHGVDPVIKGIRYAAVSWILGPEFK